MSEWTDWSGGEIEPPQPGPASLGESGYMYWPRGHVRLHRCRVCLDEYVSAEALAAHQAEAGHQPPPLLPEPYPQPNDPDRYQQEDHRAHRE